LAKSTFVRGQPHQSAKVPEEGEVVSVQLTKEDIERVGTIHVLENETRVMKQERRGQQPSPGEGRNDGDKKDKDNYSKGQAKESKSKAKESKGKSTDRHGRVLK
jgi:hypothetical protein